jgi:hypothetical protein
MLLIQHKGNQLVAHIAPMCWHLSQEFHWKEIIPPLPHTSFLVHLLHTFFYHTHPFNCCDFVFLSTHSLNPRQQHGLCPRISQKPNPNSETPPEHTHPTQRRDLAPSLAPLASQHRDPYLDLKLLKGTITRETVGLLILIVTIVVYLLYPDSNIDILVDIEDSSSQGNVRLFLLFFRSGQSRHTISPWNHSLARHSQRLKPKDTKMVPKSATL